MNIGNPIGTEKTDEITKFQPIKLTFNNLRSYLRNVGPMDVKSCRMIISVSFTEEFIKRNLNDTTMYIIDDHRCNVSVWPEGGTTTSVTEANKKKKPSRGSIETNDYGFNLIPEIPTTHGPTAPQTSTEFAPAAQYVTASFGSIIVMLPQGVSLSPQDLNCEGRMQLVKSPIVVDHRYGPLKEEVDPKLPKGFSENGVKQGTDITNVQPDVEILNALSYNSNDIVLIKHKLISRDEVKSMITLLSIIPPTIKERPLRAKSNNKDTIVAKKRPTSKSTPPIDQELSHTELPERSTFRKVVTSILSIFKKRRNN